MNPVNPNFRLYLLLIFVFLFGGILIAKLFFIQIISGDQYKALANSQYVSSGLYSFDRGSIYFQEKNGMRISAAVIKDGNPRGEYPKTWRYYPGGSLASHLLGFVGYKGDDLVGRYGLEKFYDDLLRRDEEISDVNSFADALLDLGRNFLDLENKNEKGEILLTIEPKVQGFLEENLEKILGDWQASLAGGIILEPSTGRILAMAAKPDFDPNLYWEEEDFQKFLNPNVQSVFEFGSIMKPLTIAAGLNEKVITPKTTYFDKGYLEFGSSRIENYDGKGRGTVDMGEVLNQSLNTGAVFVMQRIGKKKFYEYIQKYGLGEKTGIDLPGEVAGLTGNLKSFRDIEYATASYGQGIAIVPINMARALASLANGGEILKPYVAERLIFGGLLPDKVGGKVLQNKVFSKETTEEISRMLTVTVDEALLGGSVKMENYSVAAKTGTAQMSKENGRGYEDGKFLHSFFGYAPAFEAKFFVFLYLKEPIGARYASETLTGPFMDIMKFLLNYYEIPPDR